MIILKKYNRFIFLFFLLYMHIMRNVSSLYIVLLVIVYLTILLPLLLKLNKIKSTYLSIYISLFVITALWASLYTLILYDLESFLNSIVRYFFVIPIVLVTFFYIKDEKDIDKWLKFVLFFVLTSLIFFPIQYIWGGISWLAEPGERAGIFRYSTNLGSLPTTGIAVTLVLFIVLHLNFSKLKTIIISSILILGALFTLQKAAILGVGIIMVYVLLFKFKKNIKTSLIIIPVIIAFLFISDYFLNSISEWKNIKAYTTSQISNSDDNITDLGGDVGIEQGITERIFGSLVIQSLGWLNESQGSIGYLIGGSFGMLGPALLPDGKSKYFTAHNGYIDFLLVGGIFHLFSFIAILIRTMKIYWRSYIQSRRLKFEIKEFYFCCFGLLVLISIFTMFGGAVTFQPIVAGIFWVLVGFAWKIENRHIVITKQDLIKN